MQQFDNSFVKHNFLAFHIDTLFEQNILDLKDIQSISICSDGIYSYNDSEKKSINQHDMVEKFISYKRANGEFVKSNMLFLRKTNEKQGITHYDDISCATIIIEKEK